MSFKQSSCIAIVLCALLVAGNISAHEQEKEKEQQQEQQQQVEAAKKTLGPDGREIISVEYKGHIITIPVFVENPGEFSKKRLEFDRELSVEVIGLIRELAYKLVIEKRMALFYGTPIVAKLMTLAYSKSKEVKKLNKSDPSPPISEEFTKQMSAMMMQMYDAHSKQKLSREQCYEKIDILLTAGVDLCAKSPTGLYMDWTQLEVDGQNMSEFTKPVIQWFRSHGYDLALRAGKQLAGFLSDLKL